MADAAVARVLGILVLVLEGVLLVRWRQQRYIGGTRVCLQVPACPGVHPAELLRTRSDQL
jgi:hypothetical protein